ncbi:hypothetical protein C0389_03235 [bacterium]|nr:hypothetical protein [bacterium]
MKKLSIIIAVILVTGVIAAQQTIKMSAQIRPRLELDNRSFNSSTPFNNYTYLRTRLGVSFISSAEMSGFVQLQDARIFGNETSTTADMKNVDLHQAYFKIDNFFKLPIDIKAGRMELQYSNERIIGISNWGNAGRSFDGAVLSIKGEKFKADIFGVKENEKLNTGDTLDQNMYGIFTDLILLSNYKIQPFIIWQRAVPSNLLNRFTLGTYIKVDISAFTHETEFIFQFGDITASGRKQNITAFMFAFNAAYTFDEPSKPSIGAGIDYISGDKNSLDNEYNAFNTVYGTGHKYFGSMDYFTDIPLHTYGLGIMDLIARGALTPIENFKVALAGHIFLANADYRLKNGSTTKNFGSEVDLTVSYKYNDNVTLEGNASLYSPGEIFKEKKGSDTATWFYLMAVVNM